MAHIGIRLDHHDTPSELYKALARVFGEHVNEGTHWVALTVDDVDLYFFAPRDPRSAESWNDELDEQDDDPNDGIDLPIGPLNPQQEASVRT